MRLRRFRLQNWVFTVILMATTASGQSFRVGLSVSPFTESQFARGIVYSDGRLSAHDPAELQRLFVAHGASEVFARIATEVNYAGGSGDHSLSRGLERAHLAAQIHLPLNPEIGLFAVYGDARCQPPPDFSGYANLALPGPWPKLTLEQMAGALRTYGSLIARRIVATGASVGTWTLGNEIEFGVAGVTPRPDADGCSSAAFGHSVYQAPDAIDSALGRMRQHTLLGLPEAERIAWLRAHVWPAEARLLAATAAGIRTVDPKARFSAHVSAVAALQPELAAAFFEAMRAGGFDFDELGISYYPTWTSQPRDRLQAFQSMAKMLHNRLGRPVFVAEYGYPAATMHGAFPWNNAVPGYPLDPAGQAAFLRTLAAWGAETHILSGIRPWAPDLVAPGWGPMAFFGLIGKTAISRPALDSMANLPHD